MDISVERSGGVDVIQVAGAAALDAPTQLREAIGEQMLTGQRRFVLKLKDGSFLDSMMLGEVVACHKRVREFGGAIKLAVAPDGIAHSLIQMTGLDRAFEVYGDERDAVAAFAIGQS